VSLGSAEDLGVSKKPDSGDEGPQKDRLAYKWLRCAELFRAFPSQVRAVISPLAVVEGFREVC